jgi:hypothetical protein
MVDTATCETCGYVVSVPRKRGVRAFTCVRCGDPLQIGEPLEVPAQRVHARARWIQAKGRRVDLRKVALYQRIVLICIACSFAIFPCHYLAPPAAEVLVLFCSIAISVVDSIFVFRLAFELCGTAGGVILGVLTLIPCFGYLMLLVVEGQATRILRANGYRVGLFGASLAQFRDERRGRVQESRDQTLA